MSDPDKHDKVNRIERRKQEFRDKITRAAITLFEEKGVNGTSVAAIIKEADIAHKTFFNHFPTKEHLLFHICTSFGERAYAVFREDFKQQDDPRKRLELCLMSVARSLDKVHPHYRQLLNVYLISGSGSQELQRYQREQFTGIINQNGTFPAQRLRCQGSGVFSDINCGWVKLNKFRVRDCSTGTCRHTAPTTSCLGWIGGDLIKCAYTTRSHDDRIGS